MMVKEEETIALGAINGLVADGTVILDLTVAGECNAEAIRGGFPTKVMDEELLLGMIEVSKVVNLNINE